MALKRGPATWLPMLLSNIGPNMAAAACANLGAILEAMCGSHNWEPCCCATFGSHVVNHCQPFRMDPSHLSNHHMWSGIPWDIPYHTSNDMGFETLIHTIPYLSGRWPSESYYRRGCRTFGAHLRTKKLNLC